MSNSPKSASSCLPTASTLTMPKPCRARQAGGDTFEQYLGKVLEPKFRLDAGFRP